MNFNIIKYFFVGGICTLLDLSLFYVFAKVLHYNYLIVSSIGFTLAVLLNYALCIKYIFQSGVRFSKNAEIVSVFLVSFMGLALNQGVLFCFAALLGTDILLSKIIATGAVFFWNYFSRSAYVFRES